MKVHILRIFVVLPMYGGSLPIGRYCARAFEEMGHIARTFEAPLFYSAFSGIKKLGLSPARATAMENSFLNVISQAIWAQAEEFQPDMVLAMAQAPLGKSLLLRLRRAGIRTAMWFVEDFRIFTYWQVYAPLYDIFAVIQKEPFLSELKTIGQSNSLYLPLAALPSFHKRISLGEDEKKYFGSDISFMGAGYPNRRVAFRPLAGKDFKIWGSDWDGEGILKRNIQRAGERISEQDSLKIYSASKINLNLHSSLDSQRIISMGDFVNPRTFELAAIGAFQLVDQRLLMDELFPGGMLATFDSIEGLYKSIAHYLEHPDERAAMAQKARQHVLAEHTYERRMRRLLDFTEERLGPWRKRESVSDDSPDLDPHTARELEELKKELGIGPNAPFEVTIASLRAKTGRLSGLETGLLFLDEWRKQYRR